MEPLIFENSTFSLTSLWIFGSFGFLIGINHFLVLAKRNRLNLKILSKYQTLLIIAVLILSRIGGLISNWNIYEDLPLSKKLLSLFVLWDRQYSFIFGVIAFFLLIYFILKKEEENPARWMDIMCQSILIILFFHSLGSLLDGQLYGKETSLPWGIILENTNVSYTVPIHPTQIYAAIYTTLIFILINKFQKSLPFFQKAGNSALIIIFLYSTMKFLEIFFRGDEVFSILTIRIDHIISFLGIVISLIQINKYNNLTLGTKFSKLLKKHLTKV